MLFGRASRDLTLFAGLLVGQAADIVTTNISLRQGIGWEANPIIALAQAHFGTPWWIPKLVLVALVGIAVLGTRVRRLPVTLVVAGSWIPPVINLLQLL